MFDPGLLATFVLVVLGLFAIPGPAVLLTLARSVSGGRRVGIATGLGIAAGDLVHTVMAVIGLSALLMTSAIAFDIVKYLGVAYLVWLGLRALFEKSESLTIPTARRVTPAVAFRQAVLTELLNPKTSLFFLAFLPQFVRPGPVPAVLQLGVLGLIFVGLSAVYITLVAIGAGAFGRWLARHRNIGRWQGKIVGSIYLGLGVKLALHAMTARSRLAVDIGGTFTDLVLALPDRTLSTKLLTTHDAPDAAVITGAQAILAEAGIPASSLDLVIHGTTLATNALIERKGARTALITTAGFRDSLEIAYEHRFEQYDLYMERPEPLVSRDLRLEVPERLAADGSTLLALDEAALRRLVPILRGQDIESIAISFLHSYRNPSHEERARDVIARAMPGVAITISSEVCREIREYERTSTVVANAYVLPMMERYLARMQQGLRGLGADCPLLLMMSSGGICTVETALRFPVRLVESGPAGGAILARHVAARGGYDRAISFDMGGTTAKITLIDDFTPQHSRHFEVARAYRFAKGSGFPVRIPVIDMVEIGAGGGSIARIDTLRRIVVGPDSAGAEPGPACYARGGTQPTVTDADVVLGRIDPRRFAGGKLALEPARALEAVTAGIGASLGMAVTEAARGIAEIVDEQMASAARVHAVENGKDTSERTLIAFGGAAPLHAVRLAQKLGIRRVVIPPDAGVGSAHGFLGAPIAYEVVRAHLVRLDALDQAVIDTLFQEMRAEAEAVVRLGAPAGELMETRTAYMRYRGQGHEVAVPLPEGAIDPAALRAAFDETYRRLYGRIIPRLEIEALTWTLALSQPYELPQQQAAPPDATSPSPDETCRIVDTSSGEAMDAATFRRAALTPGARIAGPAIITEAGTSTLVPLGWSARIDAAGAIVIEETNA